MILYQTIELTALYAAIVVWVFCEVLTAPDMIFNGYRRHIDKHFPDWLFKILGGCTYCTAGQFALWSYLLSSSIDTWSLREHIYFIILTLFFTAIIKDKIRA